MRVFVTGATGGIGTFVVKELLRQGFEVAGLTRNQEKQLPQGAQAITGDLMDIWAFESQLTQFKPDTIVHLGWLGVDQKEKSNPGQIHNLQATVDLLKLGHKVGVRNFIGMGSESEYGVHNKKIDESAAVMPLSKYAIAKLATGLMAEKICHDHNMNFVWLRLFSSYGPGDRPGSLMSLLIKTLLADQPMNLSKCEQVWDYVHVQDIASLIATISKDIKVSGFYNLGGNQAQPIKNVVLKIAELINKNAVLNFGAIPYGPTQNMHLEADTSKLKKVYGWEPKISLEQGLTETVQWHKDHLS